MRASGSAPRIVKKLSSSACSAMIHGSHALGIPPDLRGGFDVSASCRSRKMRRTSGSDFFDLIRFESKSKAEGRKNSLSGLRCHGTNGLRARCVDFAQATILQVFIIGPGFTAGYRVCANDERRPIQRNGSPPRLFSTPGRNFLLPRPACDFGGSGKTHRPAQGIACSDRQSFEAKPCSGIQPYASEAMSMTKRYFTSFFTMRS